MTDNVISKSSAFIDWQECRSLVDDLETQRRAIVDHVGPADPKEALDLIWSFTGLAGSVFAHCDDSSGTIIGIFHRGAKDLARLAETAQSDAVELADRTYQALLANDYGQYDQLIATLSGSLGCAGLAHLKQRLITLSNEKIKKTRGSREAQSRLVIEWSDI
jgi:HPt (histidine-containing phosphotransfer) domain-containing protein